MTSSFNLKTKQKIADKAVFCYHWFMERNKLVPACYLLLEKDGQYLLSLRANTGYEDGNYTLVSGHVEQGETLRECVIREAKEEADITVQSEDLKLVHILSYNGNDAERVGFFWGCNNWDGEVTNMEPDRCGGITWFDKDNLPDNLVPDLKSALDSLKNNQNYSELNWK
jgi:8-oxo-dGTP diphosphatase